MLVSCPKCSSKYKLPDDKIRPSGTKVRCPKCQNTFYVTREEPVAPPAREAELPTPPPSPPPPPPRRPAFSQDSGATEISPTLSKAQKVAAAPPPPPQPPPPALDESENSDFYIEGAKTIVSPAPTSRSEEKIKEPSPFKRSNSKADLKRSDIEDATEFQDHVEFSEPPAAAAPPSPVSVGPEEVEPSQPLRPFGDATFAEIQQAGGRPKPQSKKWVGIVAGAFVVAIFSIFAVNNLMTHRQTKDTTAEVATTPLASTTLSIKKSAGWYRDDPSFYQDFLSQTATLPPSEQQKPETRSLVADALVSNGMILGAEDQIISGIGVASGLVAAYPTSLYGFLGLSSYALWREEIGTLSDLVKRWPTSNLTSTEYRLAKAVVDLRSQNYKAGLESLKTLLTEHPEYYRVQLWSLLGSLDHWRDGEEIFGPGKLQELIKQYERRKGAIRPGGTSPTLYQSLEKKLQKSGLMVAEAPLRKKEERREEKREEPVPKQVETPTPKQAVAATNVPLASPQVVEVKPAPAKKVATEPAPKKTAKVEKQKKSLPKPDPELVALNKQSSKAKQNAMKLFEAGNQKQRENKVDEAVSLYQNALREDPDLAEVYKQLGIIYMNRQEKDRSLRAFKIYLQLRPESEDRQVVQGWISSMQ